MIDGKSYAGVDDLISCMIGLFDEKKVRKTLGILALKRLELIITLGYPARESREKRRKPLSEVVS